MDSILKYLDAIEDVLENCKTVPFSSRVSVDKEKLYAIIDEIRLNIPNEIRQSQKVVAEHDKVEADARAKANQIIKEAEEKALRLIDGHEIYKQALEEGNEIIEESKKSARDMRLNAMDYADEILAKTEEIVKEAYDNIIKQSKVTDEFITKTIDVLYSNRMELRGVKKQ